MKRIMILGAGTAGTMMANHLRHELDPLEWEITIIDESDTHYYQPGYLFLPFDIYEPEDIKKPIRDFIPHRVNFMQEKLAKILPDEKKIISENGDTFHYDLLIVATGTKPAPEETEGMLGPE